MGAELEARVLDMIPVDGSWVLAAKVIAELDLRPIKVWPAIACLAASCVIEAKPDVGGHTWLRRRLLPSTPPEAT